MYFCNSEHFLKADDHTKWNSEVAVTHEDSSLANSAESSLKHKYEEKHKVFYQTLGA